MLLRGDVYVCHIQSMNDMARLAGFHWHAGNDNDISHKHRVSRAAAEQVFFNDPVRIGCTRSAALTMEEFFLSRSPSVTTGGFSGHIGARCKPQGQVRYGKGA
jgi:hypothetical protein